MIPQNNLVMVGEVQWCTTATLETQSDNAKRPRRDALVGRSFAQPV